MGGVVIVGALIVAPLEEVERDADEQSAGGLDPKRIRARRLLIQHRRDALHIVNAQIRMLSYIGKRIPARRAPVRGEWVEQVDFAKERSVTRCERPIFLFDVEDQDGT